jgi:ABC-type bacteriocin/lantibiotic exporter with double-glycine peptidase domain
MSLGVLVAFQMLMLAFIAPVQRLVSLGSRLQTAEGELLQLDDVQRFEPAPHTDFAAAEPVAGAPRLEGAVELARVTFGYSRLDPPLLREFDLGLAPGSRVALVGKTGSGKTTVARLVAGLLEPWSGEVRFDGRPRRELTRATLNHSLAVVDQDIFVFEGTVRDNLTLWDATIPLARVIAAAEDACIHDDVTARAGGYDGPMAEGGANWSGGQLQRLEIARALAGDPSVLILDEATSALDPETERKIHDRLRRRGCACLIVAHRLSTIRDADEIIVLDDGEVVQRGRHDELIGRPGPYSRLITDE